MMKVEELDPEVQGRVAGPGRRPVPRLAGRILVVLGVTIAGLGPSQRARGVEPHGGLSQTEVAHELARALEARVGREGRVQAYFYPTDAAALPTYFPQIDLSLEGVTIDAFRVARSDLVLRDAEVDLEGLFVHGRPAFHTGHLDDGEIVLEDRDITDYIRAQSDGPGAPLRDVVVEAFNDVIRVSGRVSLGPFSPLASLRGGFEVVDGGRRVLFVPEALDFAAFGASRSTLEQIFTRINPVLDMESFRRETRLEGRVADVRIRPGVILVRLRG